jgi:nucleoside transporter
MNVIVTYLRLCIAYFCQFAIWGAWAGALGQYAGGVLKCSGGEIGSLYNAIPFGAVIAPLIIGPIADRYFASQKVMSLLHFIGGIALLICGVLCMYDLQSFPVLMMLMLLSGMCYMPTMGLLNSVIFKHLSRASLAPFVFVWGTIGWIIVNLFIAGFCGGAETPNFFLVGGGVSVFLSLYALTLPHTPPQGAPAPGEKSSGLGVMSLFKDFSFVIFVLCAFLASIPACNYFFPAQVSFLTERGYPSPVALTTLNQFSEIAFMLALPFCIPRLGLKNVVLLGMAAWSIRYFCFAAPYFATTLAGLALHGFCYTFLYVAAYMYAEKVAPAHLKASAQSMMVFLLLGVGQVLGGWGYGYMRDANPPKFSDMTVAQSQLLNPEGTLPTGNTNTASVPIPTWSEDEDSMFQYLDLAAQVNKWLGKEKEESTAREVDFGKLLKDKPLTPEAIAELNEEQFILDGIKVSRMTLEGVNVDLVNAVPASVQYTKEDLKILATEIAGKQDFSLTRADWLAAQAHDWQKIFLYPAIFIAACFVIFLLLGRNPKEEAI